MICWLESVTAIEPADARIFDLARCPACGTAATMGSPPEAEAYEAGQYAAVTPRAAKAVSLFQRAVSGQPVRMLRRAGVPAGGKVLDIGAGTGLLVRALLEGGFRATGVEPSAVSSGSAQAAGLPVRTAGLGDVEERELDAVILWQVLEHLQDPGRALQRVRPLLKSGGVLLIGVPNICSLQARIAGTDWFHLDLPRHRTHFSPMGLRTLLERSGYRTQHTHHLVWKHNPDGMWFAVLSRLGVRPGVPYFTLRRATALTRREAVVTAVSLPAIPLAVALELIAGAARHGGTFASISRARD